MVTTCKENEDDEEEELERKPQKPKNQQPRRPWTERAREVNKMMKEIFRQRQMVLRWIIRSTVIEYFRALE